MFFNNTIRLTQKVLSTNGQQRLFSKSLNMFSPSLVIGEHANGELSVSSLNAVTAATEIGDNVIGLVGGSNAKAAASELAKVSGVSKVLYNESDTLDHGLAEQWAPFLKSVQDSQSFSHILCAASSSSKSFMPRLAALLDVSPISEITAVKDEKTFVRPIYAGNALATVQSADPVKVITVRATGFEPAASGDNEASVEQVDGTTEKVDLAEWVSEELSKSERPDLATAKVVVSGGRALKSAENFKIIYDLADKLKAGVGASRAAVDAGYCPNDMQVGQTGKIVAPQLYFAVGISGAIQHVAGMKDSKIIVSINKDPEAPIFQISDYGLVGDLFDVVPELNQKLG